MLFLQFHITRCCDAKMPCKFLFSKKFIVLQSTSQGLPNREMSCNILQFPFKRTRTYLYRTLWFHWCVTEITSLQRRFQIAINLSLSGARSSIDSGKYDQIRDIRPPQFLSSPQPPSEGCCMIDNGDGYIDPNSQTDFHRQPGRQSSTSPRKLPASGYEDVGSVYIDPNSQLDLLRKPSSGRLYRSSSDTTLNSSSVSSDTGRFVLIIWGKFRIDVIFWRPLLETLKNLLLGVLNTLRTETRQSVFWHA